MALAKEPSENSRSEDLVAGKEVWPFVNAVAGGNEDAAVNGTVPAIGQAAPDAADRPREIGFFAMSGCQ